MQTWDTQSAAGVYREIWKCNWSCRRSCYAAHARGIAKLQAKRDVLLCSLRSSFLQERSEVPSSRSLDMNKGFSSVTNVHARCGQQPPGSFLNERWRPKKEKSYWSARKNMVKNRKQFGTSFQEEDLAINSALANVTWCIGKKWWGDCACSLHLRKVHVEGTKPLSSTSGITTTKWCVWYKCFYLHSLNLGTNVQNAKNSTYLTLSVLEILNPKGKRDLSGF